MASCIEIFPRDHLWKNENISETISTSIIRGVDLCPKRFHTTDRLRRLLCIQSLWKLQIFMDACFWMANLFASQINHFITEINFVRSNNVDYRSLKLVCP
jgi:hypothetical protein